MSVVTKLKLFKIFLQTLQEFVRGNKGTHIVFTPRKIADFAEYKVRNVKKRSLTVTFREFCRELSDLGLMNVFGKGARGVMFEIRKESILYQLLLVNNNVDFVIDLICKEYEDVLSICSSFRFYKLTMRN